MPAVADGPDGWLTRAFRAGSLLGRARRGGGFAVRRLVVVPRALQPDVDVGRGNAAVASGVAGRFAGRWVVVEGVGVLAVVGASGDGVERLVEVVEVMVE